ncbi:hypothetical protein JKF63_07408 [Porcisia hertigi]|uniref:MYND-type domain-containing protein n=1 Tax=Porcisia hertigi TaxID=2761500 RepID=A0A836LKV6_9TRYP|nr:hypothetical protein JKF63_07408 [Porcisia hertigi]
MPPHSAAPPPPPPRPDPVTLDQIFAELTAVDVSYNSKAYHLIALSTVAFHPSVKLFLFEDPAAAAAAAAASTSSAAAAAAASTSSAAAAAAASTSSAAAAAVAALNKGRREKLLKSIAFMLAQRNNAICHECRWETVSLLGELCRMESAHSGAPTSALGQLEAKLNKYAKENLEYLAQLPWFLPAINSIIKAGGGAVDEEANGEADGAAGEATQVQQQQGASGASAAVAASSSSSPSPSRSALKEKLKATQEANRNGGGGADGSGVRAEGEDEDVVIALLDIRRALPRCRRTSNNSDGAHTEHANVVFEWSDANVEQARDLMFVDASTSMLHLVPNVTRSCSDVCAQCQKRAPTAVAAASAATPLLRCSSCKAVYYCTVECQKTHWATVHRTPCRAYRERCDRILEQYYASNTASGKKKRQMDLKRGEVVILEVPLEPSLFFETRRYLYDHRDESFAHVDYSDYFMKYTVRGS